MASGDTTSFSPAEMRRYARQISMPEFGIEGQRRLKQASVLCIGAGGLGSPIAMYLAAAGIGTLGLADADVVEESNLQRQLLYGTGDLGKKKLAAAAARLREINPHVILRQHEAAFTAANAMDIARGYDVIIDGTDNFPTRYLSSDVAVWLKKPNIYGSILRFEGQVTVFAPHLGGPCYRCMMPQPPRPGLVPTCAEGGVLGVLPGLIGVLQATEAIKVIAAAGEALIGRLLHVDALAMRFRTIQLRRDPDCLVCGSRPTITVPVDYQGFCGVPAAAGATDIPAISVADLRDLRDSGAEHFLLDVREPHEHAHGAIAGAAHIPLGQLADRMAEVPRDRRVVIHCKMGGRSAKAVALLKQHGWQNVWNVSGGIAAWSKEIDPEIAVL